MLKGDMNSGLRKLVKEKISLDKNDRLFLKTVYDAFSSCFRGQTIQIGSVPRRTAIKPLHDLDILILSGDILLNGNFSVDPESAMKYIHTKFTDDFLNPTDYEVRTRIQTHSVGIYFYNNSDVVFSVDLVPSYTFSKKNNYGDDVYKVPEIVRVKKANRDAYYDSLTKRNRSLSWVDTDPRGYINDGVRLNEVNEDFRRSVKLLKSWKGACKDYDNKFKLKSFHIEQILYNNFFENEGMEMVDAIYSFLIKVSDHISVPKIKDRADNSKYIDQYIEELSFDEKNIIKSFADKALIALESLDNSGDFESLITSCSIFSRSDDEQFLFDSDIRVHSVPSDNFKIDGYVRTKSNAPGYYLSKSDSSVQKGRKIEFKIINRPSLTASNNILWKVKNSNSSREPRGELSNGKTMNYPETTAYLGKHYVEAYVIEHGICVARSACPVTVTT